MLPSLHKQTNKQNKQLKHKKMENIMLQFTWVQKGNQNWFNQTGLNFIQESENYHLSRIVHIKQNKLDENFFELDQIIKECLDMAKLTEFLLSKRSMMTFEEHRSGGLVIISLLHNNC